MTALTTITKNMVHLPAVLHTTQPKKILLICMGMDTALRSATSWPFESITVAELSRGVTQSFGYFHANAAQVIADPRVHVVVDDGRRFLLRNKEKYDIITLDPPPPVDASGSGLLYSSEFMGIIASRLNAGGILAHWTPDAHDTFLTRTMIQSIQAHFKYVRLYNSVDSWGLHVFASNSPLPTVTAEEYLAKLPESARTDVVEFQPATPLATLADLSVREIPLAQYIPAGEPAKPLSDDRLYNEFHSLRDGGLIHP